MAYFVKVKVKKKLRCIECGIRFELNSNRVRKYCSYACAHRATARTWRREHRKAVRK